MNEEKPIEEILKNLGILPDTQKKILIQYYFENKRTADIAKELDLTENRVCQLHANAIRTLRGKKS